MLKTRTTDSSYGTAATVGLSYLGSVEIILVSRLLKFR